MQSSVFIVYLSDFGVRSRRWARRHNEAVEAKACDVRGRIRRPHRIGASAIRVLRSLVSPTRKSCKTRRFRDSLRVEGFVTDFVAVFGGRFPGVPVPIMP